MLHGDKTTPVLLLSFGINRKVISENKTWSTRAKWDKSRVRLIIPLISCGLKCLVQWNDNQPQSHLLNGQTQLIECGLWQDDQVNDPIKLSNKPYQYVWGGHSWIRSAQFWWWLTGGLLIRGVCSGYYSQHGLCAWRPVMTEATVLQCSELFYLMYRGGALTENPVLFTIILV